MLTTTYTYGMSRESMVIDGYKGYYQYDGRTSVANITGQDGDTMVSYTYTTFGVDTTFPASKQPYVKNPYRYNGEYIDFIHGAPDLQYLRARYYDAAEGRFTSRDTVWGKIETPLSQNLYTYTQNNPVNFIDPSGNFAISSALILCGLLITILAIPSSAQQPDYVGMSQDNVDMFANAGTVIPPSIFLNSPFAPIEKLMPNAEISMPGQASGKNYGSPSYPIYETTDPFGLYKAYKVTGQDGKTLEFIDYALAASYSSACDILDKANLYEQAFDANGRAIQSLGLDIALTGLSMRISAPSGKVTVNGKSMPFDEWYYYMDDAMKQIDQDKIMLGKYDGRGPTSYITKAGSDHTYFDMGDNWGIVQKKYGFTDGEMFELFNVEFLDAGIDHMKQFDFSHMPKPNGGALWDEFKYLYDYNYPTNLPNK